MAISIANKNKRKGLSFDALNFPIDDIVEVPRYFSCHFDDMMREINLFQWKPDGENSIDSLVLRTFYFRLLILFHFDKMYLTESKKITFLLVCYEMLDEEEEILASPNKTKFRVFVDHYFEKAAINLIPSDVNMVVAEILNMRILGAMLTGEDYCFHDTRLGSVDDDDWGVTITYIGGVDKSPRSLMANKLRQIIIPLVPKEKKSLKFFPSSCPARPIHELSKKALELSIFGWHL